MIWIFKCQKCNRLLYSDGNGWRDPCRHFTRDREIDSKDMKEIYDSEKDEQIIPE